MKLIDIFTDNYIDRNSLNRKVVSLLDSLSGFNPAYKPDKPDLNKKNSGVSTPAPILKRGKEFNLSPEEVKLVTYLEGLSLRRANGSQEKITRENLKMFSDLAGKIMDHCYVVFNIDSFLVKLKHKADLRINELVAEQKRGDRSDGKDFAANEIDNLFYESRDKLMSAIEKDLKTLISKISTNKITCGDLFEEVTDGIEYNLRKKFPFTSKIKELFNERLKAASDKS